MYGIQRMIWEKHLPQSLAQMAQHWNTQLLLVEAGGEQGFSISVDEGMHT